MKHFHIKRSFFLKGGTEGNLTDDHKFLKQIIELPSSYVTFIISQWTFTYCFVDMGGVFVQNHAARISA